MGEFYITDIVDGKVSPKWYLLEPSEKSLECWKTLFQPVNCLITHSKWTALDIIGFERKKNLEWTSWEGISPPTCQLQKLERLGEILLHILLESLTKQMTRWHFGAKESICPRYCMCIIQACMTNRLSQKSVWYNLRIINNFLSKQRFKKPGIQGKMRVPKSLKSSNIFQYLYHF